jgi:mannose PTS system EIIA component
VIGILLITHNGLGDSLADCVRHVLGSTPPNLRVLKVLANDDPRRKEEEGRALIAQLDTGDGVLLLTDLFGSTPCNIAQRLCRPGHVEGVSGVNLLMLLRAVHLANEPLAEVARKALEGGRECIVTLDGHKESCNAATGSPDH